MAEPKKAKPPAAKPPPKEEPVREEEPDRASELDEATHREMIALYEEAARSIRFGKIMQWVTVWGTLLGDAALVHFYQSAVGPGMGKANALLANQLTGAAIFAVSVSIFLLVLFQIWQHNENCKIAALSPRMSTAWTKVRKAKSRLEGNIHRYIILAVLMLTLVLGNVITVLLLDHMQAVAGR
ncbi:hypothetical protein JCM17960_09660 [Magnetospira thiophila]